MSKISEETRAAPQAEAVTLEDIRPVLKGLKMSEEVPYSSFRDKRSCEDVRMYNKGYNNGIFAGAKAALKTPTQPEPKKCGGLTHPDGYCDGCSETPCVDDVESRTLVEKLKQPQPTEGAQRAVIINAINTVRERFIVREATGTQRTDAYFEGAIDAMNIVQEAALQPHPQPLKDEAVEVSEEDLLDTIKRAAEDWYEGATLEKYAQAYLVKHLQEKYVIKRKGKS